MTEELAISPSSNLTPIEVMKWQAENFESLKAALVKGKQIMAYEGKPFIMKSGWRGMSTAFGLSQEIISSERITARDDLGEYYVWKYMVRVVAPNGRHADCEGACSSRDPFFAKTKGGYRPTHEINESDIIHTAQTVGYNRAISDLVGGGELSWEEVQGKGGPSVTYTPKPAATPAPATEETIIDVDPDTGEVIEPPADTPDSQRAEISRMLQEMCGGDFEKEADLLEMITEWTDKKGQLVQGRRDVAKLTDKQMPVVYGKIKTVYLEWKAGANKND